MLKKFGEITKIIITKISEEVAPTQVPVEENKKEEETGK